MKVLKFTASWCGPCKNLTENLKHVSTELTIFPFDIDENADLCAKYNVRTVPTLILTDDSGTEIKRRAGSGSTSQLEEWLNAL